MAASIFTPAPNDGNAADPAAGRMDAMYRHQRHIYDLTRKFYLFGRDQLLASLPAGPGAHVLEMGCGTGRNLVKLARLAPQARLYGVDVSEMMLETASGALKRAGLAGRVGLAQAGGQGFDAQEAFGIAQFDTIYFSYVLSMIPGWRPVVERALDQLKPGGMLAVVDFGDQLQAPAWRRTIMLGWLARFDVHPNAEIEQGLREIAAGLGGLVLDQDIFNGYAYILGMRKPG
jgi:S-adenosylmethionine-diacylgycerolhomoserine-N-methlytransferase